MKDKEIRPFGTWPSQISAEMLSAGIRLNDVQWARGSDTLVCRNHLKDKQRFSPSQKTPCPTH